MLGPLNKNDESTHEFASKMGILGCGMLQKYIYLLWKDGDEIQATESGPSYEYPDLIWVGLVPYLCGVHYSLDPGLTPAQTSAYCCLF